MSITNKDLFEQLYTRYYHMSYGYILSKVRDPWTAEDIVSDVFMKIYKHRDEINNIEKSGSWIIKIANNTIIDFYRKNNKSEPQDKITGEPVYEIGYDNILIRDEYISVTQVLPEEIKELLAMRFFKELQFKEIGRLINLPEDTAKRKVYSALKTARKMYMSTLQNA